MAKKRLARLKIDDYKCCRCGSKHDLQVHHTNYGRFGNEDEYNDLITLCDTCHAEIEHSPEIGSAYNSFMNIRKNYGVEESVPFPSGSSVICSDVDFSPLSMHLDNGSIRLCSVRFSPNDYFENRNLYDTDRKFVSDCPFEDNLLDFEEYQWQCDKEWLVFVKSGSWWDSSQGLSFVFKAANVEHLNNGLSVLSIGSPFSREGYMPIGKKQAKEIEKILDKLQLNYEEIAFGHHKVLP